MPSLILRANCNNRIFPLPGENFYQILPPAKADDRLPSARILELAYAPLRKWSRWTGYGLMPIDHVARMLTLHRLAFEAERNGREKEADFFWQEAITDLTKLSRRELIWQAVWEAKGKNLAADAEELRKRIALEVFADVHIAFANARFDNIELPAATDLAFRHLKYLRAVLPLAGVTAGDQAKMLAPALEAQIDALEKAKLGDEAIAVARDLLAMDPENINFQNRLALAQRSAAVQLLSERPDGKERAEAERLRQATEQLGQLRRRYPYNLLIYDLIGHLHFLRAIRLANGKNLSESLVAARKAQTFSPSLGDATTLMGQLIELMKKLQEQMAEVQKRLQQRPNTSLTADGKTSLAQARQGFGPLEIYMKSDERTEIVATRAKAQARTIWLEIGLHPADSDWDGRAASLLEAANTIFPTDPPTIETFLAAFKREEATRPELAGIDAHAVAAFVKRRREGTSPPAQDVAAPSVAAMKISRAESGSRLASGDREPLGYWFFGHQDYGPRVLALAAILVLLVVAAAGVFDAFESRARSTAYAAIAVAASHDDDVTVVREAERFLATPTLSWADPREAQVRSLLREAREAPSRRVRDAAFKQTQAALARGDDFAVLQAVEKFAAAPPLTIDDKRATLVRDIYARGFVRWFASLDGGANAAAATQSQTYQIVSNKLARMAGERQ